MMIPILLILLVAYASSNEEQSVPVLVGKSYTVFTNFEGARNVTGIKRQLFSDTDYSKWQYFHFCTKDGKNKATCGAWVDEAGKKISGANNNVKKVEDGGEISKMQLSDSGRYSRHPANSDELQAILETVKVYVQEGPKPPPSSSVY